MRTKLISRNEYLSMCRGELIDIVENPRSTKTSAQLTDYLQRRILEELREARTDYDRV